MEEEQSPPSPVSALRRASASQRLSATNISSVSPRRRYHQNLLDRARVRVPLEAESEIPVYRLVRHEDILIIINIHKYVIAYNFNTVFLLHRRPFVSRRFPLDPALPLCKGHVPTCLHLFRAFVLHLRLPHSICDVADCGLTQDRCF